MAMTIIQVQQQYIDTVNAGCARWSHRKNGGHLSRIMRGARRIAERKLAQLGMDAAQIQQAVKDARDIAELERMAEV